jgi:hypothetical protein
MRREHRDAAAYELGVLDDAEEFETHLAGCPRCQELLTDFRPVSAALAEAARLGYLPGGGGPPASGDPAATRPFPRSGAAGPGYPPPSGGAARRRKPSVFTGRAGPAAGALLLLVVGMAVTIGCAARPATARTWFAAAASIVSPAQVVTGTGHDLRDLPWSAGFQ